MELTQSQNEILRDVLSDVEAIMSIYQRYLSNIGAAHYNLTSLFHSTISYQILNGDISKITLMSDEEFMDFLYKIIHKSLEDNNEF